MQLRCQHAEDAKQNSVPFIGFTRKILAENLEENRGSEGMHVTSETTHHRISVPTFSRLQVSAF